MLLPIRSAEGKDISFDTGQCVFEFECDVVVDSFLCQMGGIVRARHGSLELQYPEALMVTVPGSHGNLVFTVKDNHPLCVSQLGKLDTRSDTRRSCTNDGNLYFSDCCCFLCVYTFFAHDLLPSLSAMLLTAAMQLKPWQRPIMALVRRLSPPTVPAGTSPLQASRISLSVTFSQ